MPFNLPSVQDATSTVLNPYKKKSPEVREAEYNETYQPIMEEHKVNLNQTLADERELARRQAAGKLGFAMSSGPGTSGLAVAADNALNRQFAVQAATDRNTANQFETQFKLNWNTNYDQFDRNVAMSNIQFLHQQALIQQQAELNSASWWEQLGGIIGFGLGIPMTGGMSVAGYALGQVV